MTAQLGKVRGLLFDLDGTLVGTKQANFFAYRDAFAEFGQPLPAEVFEKTWGQDSRDFIPELIPGIQPEEVDHMRWRKSVLYEKYLDRTVANTALIEFLRMVRPDHKTAIVSTAKSVNGRQILELHGLEPLFDVLIFGDSVVSGKPDPEGYRMAIELLGIQPGEGLAFEDSAAGQEAALAAGLQVIEVAEFE
ncbi:MAG TPA: HAD family phosphatase [Actinomycetota bacterium]|nr:HAD family phosphatase [Actinomycetota bacterium]